jgi:hypothetical protein
LSTQKKKGRKEKHNIKRHQISPVGGWLENPTAMGFYFRLIYEAFLGLA